MEPAVGYPLAARKPYIYTMCGRTLEDPYAWLENRDDPQVRAWVAEENACTDRYFAGMDGALERRVAQKRARREGNVYSGVTRCGGRLYALRQAPDGATAAVALDDGFHELHVLLDGEMTGGRMNIFGVSPCPDRSGLCAFFALKHGAARMTVVVRDVERGETLAELDGTFSYAWASDGRGLYYSDAVDGPDGATANRLRRWDAATREDRVLYTHPGHAAYGLVSAGPDGDAWVHFSLNYHDIALVWVSADGEAHPFPVGPHAWQYVGALGARSFFITDLDAPRGRVVSLEAGRFDFQSVAEVLPEGAGSLEGAAVTGDKLVANHLEDAASVLRVVDLNTCAAKIMPCADPIGSAALCNVSPDGSLYCTFESFTCAPAVLRCDAETGTAGLVYSSGGAPGTDLVVERRFVSARDGARLPIFLVHRKDVTPDGAVPTLFYGYGGYGAATPPASRVVDLSVADWADRGGLYVHCVLRGGSDYGAEWHLAGCRENKKNCYYDFFDITEAVIAEGWTSPEHTAVCGMSNGGLLVSVLTTMRPDLYACAIASVPHTDMLRFVFDDRGPMYITEYGDPRTEELFAYMKSYSPYHNVTPGVRYPAIYIQTGEMDNNVPPYHGKKLAAALQAAGGERPALLRVLPMGSHDRGTGETRLRTTAEMELFLEENLGIRKGGECGCSSIS